MLELFLEVDKNVYVINFLWSEGIFEEFAQLALWFYLADAYFEGFLSKEFVRGGRVDTIVIGKDDLIFRNGLFIHYILKSCIQAIWWENTMSLVLSLSQNFYYLIFHCTFYVQFLLQSNVEIFCGIFQ